MKFAYGKHVNMSIAMEHRHDSDVPSVVAHAIPGVMVFLVGMNVAYCTVFRYFLCERETKAGLKSPRRFESSLLYPVWPKSGKPIESYFAIPGCCLGMIIHAVFFGLNKYWIIHNLLYMGFLLTAVIDYIGKKQSPMPKHSEYYAALVLLFADALIVYSHSYRQSMADSSAHARVSLICIVLIFVILVEVHAIHKIHAAFARGIIIQLFGVWFCFLGRLVLHPFNLMIEFNTHHSVMEIDMAFVGALFSCTFISIVLGLAAYCRAQRLSLKSVSIALDNQYALLNNYNNCEENIKKISLEFSEPLLKKPDTFCI